MHATTFVGARAARRAEQGAKAIDQRGAKAGRSIAVESRQLRAEVAAKEPRGPDNGTAGITL